MWGGPVANEKIRRVPTRKAIIDRTQAASGGPGGRRGYRVALAVVGLSLLLLAGIIIAGYVMIFVMPPRQLVVRVDDIKYTRGDMVKILRAQQAGSQFVGGDFDSSEAIFTALQKLVEDAIIAQTAPSQFGLAVSDAELDFEIVVRMTPFGADATDDPAQIEREARERYKSYLNATQLSDSEYRNVVRMNILRKKFKELLGQSVPAVAEQVHVHRIVMYETDETDIMQIKVKDAIDSGQDPQTIQDQFKEIVKEFSRDNPEIIRQGGDLGWVPRGIYSEYDSAFFDLEVGALSEATNNRDNAQEFYYFLISERSDARQVGPTDKEVLKTRVLQDWVNQERQNHDVFAVFDSEIYTWLIKQLGIARKAPTPQTGLGF